MGFDCSSHSCFLFFLDTGCLHSTEAGGVNSKSLCSFRVPLENVDTICCVKPLKIQKTKQKDQTKKEACFIERQLNSGIPVLKLLQCKSEIKCFS